MPQHQLTIVARILAKEGKADFIKGELLKLIEVTRKEDGCIDYVLHQDNSNQNLFMFYENWKSRSLWQQHMGSHHLAEYMKITDGAVEEFAVNEMSLIA